VRVVQWSSTGQWEISSSSEKRDATVLPPETRRWLVEPIASGSGTASTLDVDDDPTVIGTSAWIERDQFVYFVTLARELGDPADWGRFRDQLVSALKAAWGLDAIWLNLPADRQQRRRAQSIATTYEIVDEVRTRHDPLTDWVAFFDALWAARGPLIEPL
jgi:hypothetical protein